LSNVAQNNSIPVRTGIGLRAEHLQYIAENYPDVPWLETHSENYFFMGGLDYERILAISNHYPMSFHGVGLSLGSAEGVSINHLKKLRGLFDLVKPVLISDHVSWSVLGGHYYNDLFPLPYNQESLDIMSSNISKTQDYLGRQILVENPSAYIEFENTDMAEWDFLSKVQKNTSCGILFDVNNIYVSMTNSGQDPWTYLQHIAGLDIQEIHLAGYFEEVNDEGNVLIDNHGSRVKKQVWQLYEDVIKSIGPIPTMIEWDDNVPELSVLMEEAVTADKILEKYKSYDIAS
jgi:uncharacterized protein